MQYAYRDRRNKRSFRALWITRIIGSVVFCSSVVCSSPVVCAGILYDFHCGKWCFDQTKRRSIAFKPLELTDVERVLDSIQGMSDTLPVLCGMSKAYLPWDYDAFDEALRSYYSNFEKVNSPSQITEPIMKVAIYHRIDSDQFLSPRLEALSTDLKIKVSGSNWADVSKLSADKGNALQILMDMKKIKAEEIIAFGDYNNDLEMLELVEHSFAMANAHPNVKAIAKYETSDNNNYGVEKILEQLV